MKRNLLFLTLFFYVLAPAVAKSAADSAFAMPPAQLVTASFIDEPIASVLADIERQTAVSFLYNTSDLNDSVRVSASFNAVQLDTCLRALTVLLGDTLEWHGIGSMYVLAKKSAPQPVASTTFTAQQDVTADAEGSSFPAPSPLEQSDTSQPHPRHSVSFSLLAGYGGLASLPVTNTISSLTSTGGFAYGAAFRYRWFLSDDWLLGTGVTFRSMCGTLSFSGLSHTFTGITDTDGETCDLRLTAETWHENTTIYTVSFPLELSWQHLFSPRAGMYADLSAALLLPLPARNRVCGTVSRTGIYDAWGDLTISRVHEFVPEETDHRSSVSLRPVAADLSASLGAVLSLSARFNILLGVTASYVATDLRSSDRLPLWDETALAFTPASSACIATDGIAAIHPWAVAFVITFQWLTR